MAKAKIINGRELADRVAQELKVRVEKLEGVVGRQLRLVAAVAVEDEAGQLYVAKKKELASRLGVVVQDYHVGPKTAPGSLIERIDQWNRDNQVDGIMLQLPLPSAWGEARRRVINSINAEKDVDCLTAVNLGLLMQGQVRVLPATVLAVERLLAEAGYAGDSWQGVAVCVVGASGMVGRPLAVSLQNYGASVLMVDEYTRELGRLTSQAEVLVSATGVAGLIKGEMVKPGAVVVDVGITRQADGRLRGDVELDSVRAVAGWVTPVPGGVGPVTVVSLLQNLVSLVELSSPGRGRLRHRA